MGSKRLLGSRTDMRNNDDFWQFADRLVAAHDIVIDRPKNTPHPRWPDVIYPLDYGFLAGTTAGDGDGIDIWVGSALPPNSPLDGPDGGRFVDAIICTVDLLKKDMEIKLLLGCSEDDIRAIEMFLNKGNSLRCMVVRRGSA